MRKQTGADIRTCKDKAKPIKQTKHKLTKKASEQASKQTTSKQTSKTSKRLRTAHVSHSSNLIFLACESSCFTFPPLKFCRKSAQTHLPLGLIHWVGGQPSGPPRINRFLSNKARTYHGLVGCGWIPHHIISYQVNSGHSWLRPSSVCRPHQSTRPLRRVLGSGGWGLEATADGLQPSGLQTNVGLPPASCFQTSTQQLPSTNQQRSMGFPRRQLWRTGLT